VKHAARPLVTEKLAGFVAGCRFDDLPKKTARLGKICTLDWIGSALAGSREPPAKIVASILGEIGGNRESTVIGTSTVTSCLNAALANGVAGHSVEFDDLNEDAIIHPAAPVIPAALALAERDHLGGRRFITAVVLGYEVEVRVGEAVNPSHYRHWHTTATCGTFGAAAAAASLLELGKEETAHAFGIASTQAAGLVQAFGTMSKPLNAGKAAMNGVLAALLAKKGLDGPSDPFGRDGYLAASSNRPALSELTKGLGDHFKIMETVFKRHASCGHTHGALDALLEMSRKYGFGPEDVKEIVIGTYPTAVELVGKSDQPKTASEARFSLPYCAAAAMIDGKVGLEEFSSEKLGDLALLKLSKKVRVYADTEFAESRLGPARVKVVTVDGKERVGRVDTPRGYPANPLSERELEAKFRALALRVVPKSRVDELVEEVRSLDRTDDVADLSRLLAA
jgi:2-methylcitrate dehydratase PrpD